MVRVGIFIDVGNQYYCINKKWPGRKLNYRKYYDLAGSQGTIHCALAYGTQVGDSASKFTTCLRHLGFDPKYKTVEKNSWFVWDVGIAVDMMRYSDKIDAVVLGNSNRSMIPAVQSLRERGIKVTIVSCGINKELKETADAWLEIEEDMLETEDNLCTKDEDETSETAQSL